MIKAILIGAGQRGIGAYGAYALKRPDKLKFVGVADPDPERKGYFSYQHQIETDFQFNTYEEILAAPKMGDVCFVCTQDQMHVDPCLKALKKGYHVFLEKPMAITPEECVLLGNAAKQYNRLFMIGHVLRYTDFFSKIKEIIDAKTIGEIVTIQHNENVSYWHQAHSYVRGNWKNKETASPMILAKSCHDMDILSWLVGKKVTKVSSFGDLSYFKEKNAPKDSPQFCLDGCPHKDTCVYYAPKVYVNAPDFMKLALTNDFKDETILEKLKTSDYGRCVFHSENNVVDHQVVILEFEDHETAAFTMTGFTSENTRTIKVMGTIGEIRGHMDKSDIEVNVFGREDLSYSVHLEPNEAGHNGGDYGIMEGFVELIETEKYNGKTRYEDAVVSHLLSFAAEKSRVEQKTIDFQAYLSQYIHD